MAENSAAAGLSVEVVDAVKRYPLFARRRDRALALFGRTGALHWKTALDRVSLHARHGEAIGLIGENGSGKSTLLRLVAGISRPQAGTVAVAAPVAAILELGLGFHPEFTGRENALLYGALLGVGEGEMHERLEDVLAFAELGDFVDQPLRTYSSGMTARLAFAVATNVSPRVLVVDEALAVGDGAFQRKCVERMVRFKQEGRTVLFCSHAMHLVAGFCERAVWLHEGRVSAEGATRDVIVAYEEYLRHRGKRRAEPAAQAAPPPSGHPAAITGVRLEPADGTLAPGSPLAVHIALRRDATPLPLHVAVGFENEDGMRLAAFATAWDRLPPLGGGAHEELTLRIDSSPFTRGSFDVTVYLADENALQVFDQLLLPRALTVTAERWDPGLMTVPHRWERQ